MNKNEKKDVRKLVSELKAKLNCTYAAIVYPSEFASDTSKKLVQECLKVLDEWLVKEGIWN